MKITKNYLTKVIKEEVQKVLKENRGRESMTPRTKLYLRDLTVGTFKNAGNLVRLAGTGAFDPKTGIVTMPEKNRTVSFRQNLEVSILEKLDPEYPDGVYWPYYLQDRLIDILEDLQAEGLFTGGMDTIHTINLNF